MVPENEAQTNFRRLLGCEYGIILGEYYLHHPQGSWYHLEDVIFAVVELTMIVKIKIF